MNAYLLLANGMVFAGQSVGAQGVTVGEVVFSTGMVGFQETLTDPSYYGQIITQTYPLIASCRVVFYGSHENWPAGHFNPVTAGR